MMEASRRPTSGRLRRPCLMMNRHRDAVLSAPPDLGFNDVCRGVPRVLEPLSECFAVFHPAVGSPFRDTSHEARRLRSPELGECLQEAHAFALVRRAAGGAGSWLVDPFEGAVVDHALGRVLMARGATNQKGPERAFLNALEAIIATNEKLPVNLMVVAEGEEELGRRTFRK